jgi:hypothetical protein
MADDDEQLCALAIVVEDLKLCSWSLWKVVFLVALENSGSLEIGSKMFQRCF